MTVYLLHFHRPYQHARHYIGWTRDPSTLSARLSHHANGSGARLPAVVRSAGIGWDVARVWDDGTRTLERRLKGHGATRVCPVCSGTAALKRHAA
jgi:predicted GIY-YIG superfamily endonuclease